MLGFKLLVCLHIDIALHVTHRNDVAELRADTCDARLEAPDAVPRATVAPDLLVQISHNSDLELLGEELRCALVQMEIDAVLILGRGVERIEGEPAHGREFMTGLRIEIGVA